MKVLVTGAKGFIGHKVCWWLTNCGHEVVEFDIEDTFDGILPKLDNLDFIVHLAGVNRPTDPKDFYTGNYEFTKKFVEFLVVNGITCPIIYSSSSQALLANDYGKSKKMAEDFLLSCPLEAYVYRLDNVFGPGARPNYNSFVTTMANAIANNLEYSIDDPNKVITLLSVFRICDEFERVITRRVVRNYKKIQTIQGKNMALGTVEKLLKLFDKYPFQFPSVKDQFVSDLYLAYLSYRPDYVKNLIVHSDDRGCFVELVKNETFGQISLNFSRPGITKGGHYHTRKLEEFYTFYGKCVTRLRKIDSKSTRSYQCDGLKPKAVRIQPYYTHDITNTSDGVSLTLMWINEVYNPEDGDTFPEPVKPEVVEIQE